MCNLPQDRRSSSFVVVADDDFNDVLHSSRGGAHYRQGLRTWFLCHLIGSNCDRFDHLSKFNANVNVSSADLFCGGTLHELRAGVKGVSARAGTNSAKVT